MVTRQPINDKINEWTVIEQCPDNPQKYKVQCSCGKIDYKYLSNLRKGYSPNCGGPAHEQRKVGRPMGGVKVDLTNKKINHWTILEELGGGKVRVQCDCPAKTEAIRYKKAIISGQSKSCGCAAKEYRNDLVGKEFGSWKVLEAAGNGYEKCQCLNCGTIRDIPRSRLLNGISKSCGCMQPKHMKETMLNTYGELSYKRFESPRQMWQIETLNDRNLFIKACEKFKADKGRFPTTYELCEFLDVHPRTLFKHLRKDSLYNYVDVKQNRSQYEDEIVRIIQKADPTVKIETSVRYIIPGGKELDIYLPDKKLAIEFNGTYWHSSPPKDKNYHQEKSLACIKAGIHLIHIYEYEWKNESKKRLIKQYIESLVKEHPFRGYARDCEVRKVPLAFEKEFLNSYHLQGYTQSAVAYGLFYNNILLSIMTFGAPRFDKDLADDSYELIRYCTRPDVTVTGGAERLLHHFISENKVCQILTYSSLDKFTGNVYRRLGFIPLEPGVTRPGYVWVEPDTAEVLTRYQTQKGRLVKKGLGNESQTEDDIMYDLGYLKVYDAGNFKFLLKVQ